MTTPNLYKPLERKCVMNKGEPPSLSGSNFYLFLVGKDSHGNWVVRDQSGLCGGLFVGRAEALKFAMFENGHRPQAVIMVPGILELELSATPHSDQRSAPDGPAHARWVA
jgi:hypothetical protein